MDDVVDMLFTNQCLNILFLNYFNYLSRLKRIKLFVEIIVNFFRCANENIIYKAIIGNF